MLLWFEIACESIQHFSFLGKSYTGAVFQRMDEADCFVFH